MPSKPEPSLRYDDPANDGTSDAHPAYQRGVDAGVAIACDILSRVLAREVPKEYRSSRLYGLACDIAALRDRAEPPRYDPRMEETKAWLSARPPDSKRL